MDKKTLSKYYHLACDNAHEEIDSLYEKLLDIHGEPEISQERIISVIQSTTQRIRLELEIIKSTLQEYHEQKI